MNNEGKFKKSLSDLVNSREFEFDEANWEKASAMIDSSRGAKGWKSPFVFVSSLLLIVAGVTGAYLFYPSSTAELAVKSKTQTPATEISRTNARTIAAPETTNTASKPNEVQKSPAQRTSPLAEIKEPASNNVSKEPILKTTSEPSVEQITPANTIAENTSKISEPIAEISGENTKPPVAGDLPKTETETKRDLPVAAAPETSGLETLPVSAVTTNNSQVSPESKKIVETMPEEKAVSEPLVAVVKEETATPTIPVNVSDVSNNTNTQQIPAQETKEENTQVATVALPLKTEVKLSPEIPERPTSEPPKGVGIYPLMPQADSAMLENDKATKLTYDIKEKPVIFSIEAGVSYLYGWKNPGKTDANGYNPFVGINFFQTAFDKLSVSLGLQYTSISNLNYSSHTTKVSQLGLGEESTVTVFTPTKIHYLVAPLRVHYRLNRKNIAGLGCNFAYLLTVESDVETYHQTLTSTDGNGIYKDKGYTQGFRPFDVQLSAFYRHRLLSNISFNAEIFYGLVDAKDNTFFHSNVFERNTGLKISLVYNIQKK